MSFAFTSIAVVHLVYLPLSLFPKLWLYAVSVAFGSSCWFSNKLINKYSEARLKIICGFSIIYYEQMRFLYNLPSLFERRETLCKRFFEKSVLSSSSCLHFLLPSCRDTNIIAKLRNANVYATPTVRTNRFRKSFIMHALDNY